MTFVPGGPWSGVIVNSPALKLGVVVVDDT